MNLRPIATQVEISSRQWVTWLDLKTEAKNRVGCVEKEVEPGVIWDHQEQQGEETGVPVAIR
jgi:hypothetical protein